MSLTMADTDQQQLRLAISKAVDRFVKKHPGLHVANVCAALGAVAGVFIGNTVPPGNDEADLELGHLTGLSCAEAAKAVRKARAN